jgi:hypothetical protein
MKTPFFLISVAIVLLVILLFQDEKYIGAAGSMALIVFLPLLYWFIGKYITEENEKLNNYKSRCCGRCDGINDECFADMMCEEHDIQGCFFCWPDDKINPYKFHNINDRQLTNRSAKKRAGIN